MGPPKTVDQYSSDGKFIKHCDSLSSIARELKVSTGAIVYACKQGSTCKGYKFRYASYPDLDGEVWKPHPFHPIQCSNLGRINYKDNRKTFGSLNTQGYYVSNHKMCSGGRSKMYQVHRLIAETFNSTGYKECLLRNPGCKPQVDHINFKRSDNRIQNLQWVSQKENIERVWTLEAALFRHQKNTE